MSLWFDQRVEELFDRAADLPADARGEFLRQNCADAGVIGRVLTLLGHADRADERFLAGTQDSEPATDLLSGAGESPPISGQRLGPYTLLRLLGEGGMGTVYEAEQHHPRRRVALKLIRPGFMTAAMLRRFEYEADVLGRLEHPGIARIYHAGTVDTPHGRQPYFAMELVQGTRLDHWIKQHDPPVRKRCELLVAIGQAVHHAHTKGVIHRDLKPANILVTEDGQPKVLDFGVARAIDSDIQTVTLHTESGQMVGTMPYMAPEQAAGKVRELDTSSDVYALGVIAYEVLSGRLPYPLEGKPLHEAVRIICQTEPSRLGSIDRTLRGDVETIVLKALEKDKSRRYHTAGELAADVTRFLNYEPITARPPSSWDQLAKFAQRNKGLVGAAAAIFVSLVAGVIGMAFLAAKAQHHAAVAERRAAELDAVASFQAERLAGIDVPRMGQRLRQDLLERAGGGGGFEEVLAQINFTDAALRLLDENIFQPALHATDQRFSEQPAIQARLLQTLASTLRGLGMLAQATEPQTRALEIRRRTLGDDDPSTISSISSMGTLLRAQGQLADAEPYYREAVDRSRRAVGEDHPDTLTLIDNLASLLAVLGSYDESETLHREALRGLQQQLGDEHPQTFAAINNLGFVLRRAGKFDQAESCYREALELRRRTLGDDHPDTQSSMNNLAFLLQWQGKLDAAEPLFRQVLDTRRRTLGNLHPRTLTSINNLGMLYEAQQRYAAAEPLLREALDGCREALGEDHPDTLGSVHNLGVLLHRQERHAEAEPYFRDAWEGCRRLLGETHPDAIGSLHMLASTLVAQDKLDEAEPIVREVVRISRDTLGDMHPESVVTMYTLARLLWRQQRYEELEPVAAELFEKAPRLPMDARIAAEWAALYGPCLVKLGRYADAERALHEAYERLADSGRGGEPMRLVMASLAEACEKLARPDDAAEWRHALAALSESDAGAE